MTRSKDSLHSKAIRLAYRKGYRVTDDGRLLSPLGRELKIRAYGRNRYPTFGIKLPEAGYIYGVRTHSFAAYCFFGDAALSTEDIRHLNDDPTDLRRSNVALGTHKENFADVSPMKRATNHARLLTAADVRHIRTLLADGIKQKDIASQFGVVPAHISQIKYGRSWGAVP